MNEERCVCASVMLGREGRGLENSGEERYLDSRLWFSGILGVHRDLLRPVRYFPNFEKCKKQAARDKICGVGCSILFSNAMYSVQFGNTSYMALIWKAGGQESRLFCL